MPRLALGRILGFDAVGLFARAMTICQLPDKVLVSGLTPVVLPAMAAHARSGGDLKQGYLHGHMLMSAVQWPMLLMLALLADPVVRVLLGQQWGEVPPMVRVMALGTMALAPAFLTYPLLVSVGRVQDTLHATLISLPPSVMIIILAAPHGLQAVATSFLAVSPLQMIVALAFVRRAVGLTWQELARASAASVLITLCTAIIPALIVALSPHGFDLGWLQTRSAVLGGAIGWSVGLRLSKHPLKAEAIQGWRSAVERLRANCAPSTRLAE